MFYGSDVGGRNATVLTSLIANCKSLRIYPFADLRDVFDYILCFFALMLLLWKGSKRGTRVGWVGRLRNEAKKCFVFNKSIKKTDEEKQPQGSHLRLTPLLYGLNPNVSLSSCWTAFHFHRFAGRQTPMPFCYSFLSGEEPS
jgi:hypothetical protein